MWKAACLSAILLGALVAELFTVVWLEESRGIAIVMLYFVVPLLLIALALVGNTHMPFGARLTFAASAPLFFLGASLAETDAGTGVLLAFWAVHGLALAVAVGWTIANFVNAVAHRPAAKDWGIGAAAIAPSFIASGIALTGDSFHFFAFVNPGMVLSCAASMTAMMIGWQKENTRQLYERHLSDVQ